MKLYALTSRCVAPMPASVLVSVAPDCMRSMIRSLNFCVSAPLAMASATSLGFRCWP